MKIFNKTLNKINNRYKDYMGNVVTVVIAVVTV